MYAQAHVPTHMYMYVYVYIYKRMYVCTYVRTYIKTYVLRTRMPKICEPLSKMMRLGLASRHGWQQKPELSLDKSQPKMSSFHRNLPASESHIFMSIYMYVYMYMYVYKEGERGLNNDYQ